MKKVFIIANLYHASPRIPGITAYLPEFGWRATILTPILGDLHNLGFPKNFGKNVELIQSEFKGDIFWFWRKIFGLMGFKTKESVTEQIKDVLANASSRTFIDKIMKAYQYFFAYPDTEITWKNPAYKKSCQLIKQGSFSAIISSSPFPTNHIVASKLKNIFKLPWLADFRDPWVENHNYEFGNLRKYFERKLELKTMLNSDMMIAATSSYCQKQVNLHGKSCICITNGFDPNNLIKGPKAILKKFTVNYTGRIYRHKQNPEKLFIALNNLFMKNKISKSDIEVNFYGLRQNWLEEVIKKHSLQDVVFQKGQISRDGSLQIQRDSHLLLLLGWEDSNERGIFPSKVFEYLSAKKNILAISGFSGDDLEELIEKTNAGKCAVNIKDIEEEMANFYQEYKKNNSLAYTGSSIEISKYSYRGLSQALAQILDERLYKKA
jgi:glycosyltransferase involved in cell wall biosynthesis